MHDKLEALLVILTVWGVSFGVATLVCRLFVIKAPWPRPVLTLLLMVWIAYTASGNTCGGTASAAASNTISNLRNLKAAAMMYRGENGKERGVKLEHYTNHAQLLSKYLDNPSAIERGALKFIVTPTTWWVGCAVNDKDDPTLKEKLAGRSAQSELHGSPYPDLPPLASQEKIWFQTTDKSLWMSVYTKPKSEP